MQHKTVREVVKTKQYSLKVFNDLNDQMTRQTTWNNTNKLLTDNCRINGLKTGITNSAGGCLASTYSLPVPHY
jgi:D-alanyl-D-alanine carboxypeptidase